MLATRTWVKNLLNKCFKQYDIYSTEERKIGKWINNKPIYRKVVNFGALPNNTSKSVPHGIYNLDFVTALRGISVKSSNGLITPLIYSGPNEPEGNISLLILGQNILVYTGKDRTDFATTYVIIEYTKKTD